MGPEPGWGFIGLLEAPELQGHWVRAGVSPTGDGFTYECFREVLEGYELRERNCAKAFLVQQAPIRGIGNGCVQVARSAASGTWTRRARAAASRRICP